MKSEEQIKEQARELLKQLEPLQNFSNPTAQKKLKERLITLCWVLEIKEYGKQPLTLTKEELEFLACFY